MARNPSDEPALSIIAAVENEPKKVDWAPKTCMNGDLGMEYIFETCKKYQELTGVFSDAFVDELKMMAARPDVTKLVIDLKGTTRVGSKAISGIYSVFENLKETNRTLQIVNPSTNIVNMIKILNMQDLLAG
ncbi:MAG: STAS domain-containing protein [Planctomycetota bacterium]|nr:STAS domain-containing protein [Planctomycetota bacterium]